jgi:hypothetical protein
MDASCWMAARPTSAFSPPTTLHNRHQPQLPDHHDPTDATPPLTRDHAREEKPLRVVLHLRELPLPEYVFCLRACVTERGNVAGPAGPAPAGADPCVPVVCQSADTRISVDQQQGGGWPS